ncbi:unnamed protein product [Blepharisma stoltei]|uniref:Catalase n=1 Tax=Blepharisma stoltei TaxID=1481888 RepID=A0AAU9K0Q9_9CILI|nr:unnamed protein product [Blepharisma stoltei]
MPKKPIILTTGWGHPVDDNQNSETAGRKGPILLEDSHLIDKLASFGRERIPERPVHARGAGAYGFFEVTNDVTKYCKAKFLEKLGKKTPVFARFSTSSGERGSAETERDLRGFSIKFYTEEGNWDFVGNSSPIFGIRKPVYFPEWQHIHKKDPSTNCKNYDMFWDFLSLVHESVHHLTYIFGPRGIPDGYRHMNGYGTNTYKWVNSKGEDFFVKFHFHTEIGTKNLSSKEAEKIMGEDPDYATRDLFNYISQGKEAIWKFSVQVIPFEEGLHYKWDIYDDTKVWPHSDYPLIEVGRVVLNRNPTNYFFEVEQSAFSPANMVPGIEASNDRMLQARIFSYSDAQRYRLGGNFGSIPINFPHMARVHNYMRDGMMSITKNGGKDVSYEPNTVNDTPKEDNEYKMKEFKVQGEAMVHRLRYATSDFEQPGILYRRVFKGIEKDELITNLYESMKNVTKRHILEKECEYFYNCDPEYGTKISQALRLPVHQSKL